MTRVEQSGQSGGNSVAAKRVDFAYDAASQFDTIDRYANLAGTQLVAETAYTFDNASRLTALSHSKGQTTLAGYTWTYNAAGDPTAFTSVLDGSGGYTYDDTNQLAGATYNYQSTEAYTYDSNGNRTNTGYSTGDDNRLTSDGVYNYVNDAEGNRTKRTNVATGAVTEYTWDYRNRLVKVVERAGGVGTAATKEVDYKYDFQNRLVAESVDPDGAGEESPTEQVFVYDGSSPLPSGEGQGEGEVLLRFGGSSLSDLKDRYLWGPTVDLLLTDEKVTSPSTPGDVYWALGDNLDTVRDIAEYDSQSDVTTIANHRVYDAFGNLTSQTNAAVGCLFGFTGRQFDPETGLQYNLNRWYDPATGRWLSQDPIRFKAGDTNLNRYVWNRATSLTDPMGASGGDGSGGELAQDFDYPSGLFGNGGDSSFDARVRWWTYKDSDPNHQACDPFRDKIIEATGAPYTVDEEFFWGHKDGWWEVAGVERAASFHSGNPPKGWVPSSGGWSAPDGWQPPPNWDPGTPQPQTVIVPPITAAPRPTFPAVVSVAEGICG